MKFLTSTVMSMTFGFVLLGGAVQVSAVPLMSPATAATELTLSQAIAVQAVRFRRFGRQDGGFGHDGLGLGIGILGGSLLDDAINNGYYTDGNCSQRFRSYDPRSETYLGIDGRRHHCS